MGLKPSGGGASCSTPVSHSSSAPLWESSSTFFLAHALYLSSPESRRSLSDDLSSCHCSHWAEPRSGFAGRPINGPPSDWCCYPHPSALLPTLFRGRSCYSQRDVPLSVLYLRGAGLNHCLLVDAGMGCALSGPGTDGLVHVFNRNWKNRITPNCRPVLKNLLDKVSSGPFDFH